jgi:hypothetical protein
MEVTLMIRLGITKGRIIEALGVRVEKREDLLKRVMDTMMIFILKMMININQLSLV